MSKAQPGPSGSLGLPDFFFVVQVICLVVDTKVNRSCKGLTSETAPGTSNTPSSNRRMKLLRHNPDNLNLSIDIIRCNIGGGEGGFSRITAFEFCSVRHE